jgi:hypothetical protein
MSGLAHEDPASLASSPFQPMPATNGSSQFQGERALHGLVSAFFFFTKSLPTLQLLYDVLTMHSSTEISQSMNDNFTSQCF